jgi:hypothetical protein
MRGKLEKEGNYELFETANGHQILNLNNKNYFAVIGGQKGDILVATDSDHEKSKVLKKGRFYLADFENDPEFSDMPHLFLQEGNKYREWILPNHEPSEKDYQKKLVRTGNLVSKAKVESHVKGKGHEGSEKKYEGKSESLRSKSKAGLMEMAKKRSLTGRSKMSKEQLARKLED